jgi:hypothetical protein
MRHGIFRRSLALTLLGGCATLAACKGGQTCVVLLTLRAPDSMDVNANGIEVVLVTGEGVIKRSSHDRFSLLKGQTREVALGKLEPKSMSRAKVSAMLPAANCTFKTAEQEVLLAPGQTVSAEGELKILPNDSCTPPPPDGGPPDALDSPEAGVGSDGPDGGPAIPTWTLPLASYQNGYAPYGPRLVATSQDAFYLAWAGNTNSMGTGVFGLDSQDLSSKGFTTASMNRPEGLPALTFDQMGAPNMAWAEAGRIPVKRLDPATRTWSLLGVESLKAPVPGTASNPALVNAPAAGGLVVAWSQGDATRSIFLSLWNAGTGSWDSAFGAPLHGMSEVTARADVPWLASSMSRALIAAWVEDAGPGTAKHLFIQRWDQNAKTWDPAEELTAGQPGDTVTIGGVVVDGQDRPLVAWHVLGAGGSSEIFVRRWDPTGKKWSALAAGSDFMCSQSCGKGPPSLAVDSSDTTVYLAWFSPGGVTVWALDNDAWSPLPTLNTTAPGELSLAVRSRTLFVGRTNNGGQELNVSSVKLP